MNSKDIFPSISHLLGQVEGQIELQARQIVASWRRDGRQAEYLDRVVRHIISQPGKMLRPALVLLSAGMAGGTVEQDPSGPSLISLATAVELLHSASLIHDDIIDDEQVRRGRQALHRRRGNRTAVLVGDILYAECFSLITGLKLPEWERHLAIYRLFCDTTRDMCMGEIIEQRVLEEDQMISFDEYLHILKNKTAALMSACCRSGALLAGADDEFSSRLARFGMLFGLAFQLLDDHVDRDALINGEVQIVEQAVGKMKQARALLGEFAPGAHRDELLKACDYLLEAASVAAP